MAHDFSSTQVNLKPSDAKDVLEMAKSLIDKRDLAEDGFETAPHITVKYGLHTNNTARVRDVLKNAAPVTVVLGSTSIFEAPDYDVVKIDVEGRGLHRLNKMISKNLETTDTHPTYQPHLTLAYVKKGKGKKYVGSKSLKGRQLTFSAICFCRKDGGIASLPLSAAG